MRYQSKDIEFKNGNERLIIKDSVVSLLEKKEQRSGRNEVGGILLGYVYPNRTEIAEITTPSKFDLSALGTFIRSRKSAQKKINKAWKKSRGTLIYLGEWHTHPQVNPFSSLIDKRMIKKTLKETIMEIDFLYLIIAGQEKTYWAGKQIKRKLIELKRVR